MIGSSLPLLYQGRTIFATLRGACYKVRMMTDSLNSAPFVGRFYSISNPVDPEASLVEACRSSAWSPGRGEGVAFDRGFCTLQHPHSGDLWEDAGEIGYGGTGGVHRLSIREERRSASRQRVQAKAFELAAEQDPTTSFSGLSSSAQRRLLEVARAAVLAEVHPVVKVVPLFVSGDWLWIGNRSPGPVDYESFLAPSFGSVEMDPVIFSPSRGLGWASLSYGTLRLGASSGAKLSSDVLLESVSIRSKDLSLTASSIDEDGDKILKAVESESSGDSIRSMTFSVYVHGFSVEVGVDPLGVFRLNPPKSPGGLPHERLIRRFEDGWHAMTRLRDVLLESVSLD